MLELVKEWVRKAEADFATATREFNAPNFDAACFHAQQCSEKLLKAVLVKHGCRPPKVHALDILSDLVNDCGVGIRCTRDELLILSRAAVDFRYPGEYATLENATFAIEICSRLRDQLKEHLAEGYPSG